MSPSNQTFRKLRIFVSSPSDVSKERDVLDEVIDSINRVGAPERGLQLELFRWEKDVVPRLGPSPQDVVDAQTPPYDVYLGIMANRFGTPTAQYGSGTEQEFEDALGKWEQVGSPWILFYFKKGPRPEEESEDDFEQYKRVFRFRKKLEERGIIERYTDVRGSKECFFEQVSEHLRKLMLGFQPLPQAPPKSAPPPRPATKCTPNILLTSQSPRRKQLLEQVGFQEASDFVTVQASVGLKAGAWGSQGPTLEQAQQASVLTARSKISHAVKQMHALTTFGLDPKSSVVVGADTLVFCEGRILDRPMLKTIEFACPGDIHSAVEEAKKMLRYQSGKEIHVTTGLVVACADDLTIERSTCITTTARMKHFSDEDLERFVLRTRPFDKAGAFGIQEQGVALFEGIHGSYTNVVGLPLFEFIDLLSAPVFAPRLTLPELPVSARPEAAGPRVPELGVVSVGDITCDFVCDWLPEGALTEAQSLGKTIDAGVRRSAGGTAVYLARGAKAAGFEQSSVIGVVGGDLLGQMIEAELHQEGILSILPRDLSQHTGITIALREDGTQSRSLSVTDARQALPPVVVERARTDIKACDVLYISGHCLTDVNRQASACEMASLAKRADRLVVLDVVDDMHRVLNYSELLGLVREPRTGRPLVDVLVARLPEILGWLQTEAPARCELQDVDWLRTNVLPELHKDFTAVVLRDAGATQQILSARDVIVGLMELPAATAFPSTNPEQHARNLAGLLHQCLSPRVVLASGSPQRRTLLAQIIAPNKIEVRPSRHPEEWLPGEAADEHVERLALEKAQRVLEADEFGANVEFVIGCDTEIVVEDGGSLEAVGHPQDSAEARDILGRLSGRRHCALSGIVLIGRDPDDPTKLKTVKDIVSTQVWFCNLTPTYIERYVQTREPLSRAGGYAIQGAGGLLVKRLEGSYSNVMGLPLESLSSMFLEDFGCSVWDLDKVSDWKLPHPLREALSSPG